MGIPSKYEQVWKSEVWTLQLRLTFSTGFHIVDDNVSCHVLQVKLADAKSQQPAMMTLPSPFPSKRGAGRICGPFYFSFWLMWLISFYNFSHFIPLLPQIIIAPRQRTCSQWMLHPRPRFRLHEILQMERIDISRRCAKFHKSGSVHMEMEL